MRVYLSKSHHNLVQIYPVPEDIDNWLIHEIDDNEDYSHLQAVEVEGEWVVRINPSIIDISVLIKQLSASIDDTASQISGHWTRFADEYVERERAAIAFAQANYKGEPSIWITSFAQPAGLDNKTATQLILKQAEGLRALQTQLGALRMRKYELKQAGLTIEQLQAIHDDIVGKMTALAEAQA